MMNIRYIERNGICLTPCPFEVKMSEPFAIETRKVGSAGCRMCVHHRAQEKGFVMCNRDEARKGREV